MKKSPCCIIAYPLNKNDFFVDVGNPTTDENYFFKRYYGKTNKELQGLLKEGYPLLFLLEINDSSSKVFAYYFLGLATFIMKNNKNEEYKFDINTVYAELAKVLYHKSKYCKEYIFYNDCVIFYTEWAIENYKKMNINEGLYTGVIMNYRSIYIDIKKLMSKDKKSI